MIKLKDILDEIIAEEKKKKGLWYYIDQKHKRGERPAKKGSKAYKSAVKSAKEINKNKLEEGAIQLTTTERDHVERLLPEIIKVIAGDYLGDNMQRKIDDIVIQSADHSDKKTSLARVDIFVGNDLSMPDALAYYQTMDPKNTNDNYIFIQQFKFAKYFSGFSGLDLKATSKLTGTGNPGVDKLRAALKHELIHAKDPAINQFKPAKDEYSQEPEKYYRSWEEFQAFTGEFFEAITTGVESAIKSKVDKNKILGGLKSILDYYSGKSKIFNQDARDFIQRSGKRNIFQSLIKTAAELFVGKQYSSIEDSYAPYIAAIKRYHPESYNEFLKDLYKTVEAAKQQLK